MRFNACSLLLPARGRTLCHRRRPPFRQLFEMQTLSPGIQALRLMGDILVRGHFILRAEGNGVANTAAGPGRGGSHGRARFSLVLELSECPAESSEDDIGE